MKKDKKPGKVYIYGRHSVLEAITNKPQCLKGIYLRDFDKESQLLELAKKANIPVKLMSQKDVSSVGQEVSHQGVIGVLVDEGLFVDFSDFFRTLDLSKNPAVVVCAEVQDPHNLGAIIRSAVALGISAVILPDTKQAQISGAVVKTSVGMVFKVPLIKVADLGNTIASMNKMGFTTYGLDMEGVSLHSVSFSGPSAFVLGNEGFGLDERITNLCTKKLSIPMHPRAESLNVATSAGVVFYQWSTQHPSAL